MTLHTSFLLIAGTGATILRAGLVELPHEVDEESATGGIADGQLADAVDGGVGLVGIALDGAVNGVCADNCRLLRCAPWRLGVIEESVNVQVDTQLSHLTIVIQSLCLIATSHLVYEEVISKPLLS